MRATPGAREFDDSGVFEPIEAVNKIRAAVDAWRREGYPDTTITSRRSLEHWRDQRPERMARPAP